MGKIRKNYSASFKAKVALEAVKKEKTISRLFSEYGVHSNQMSVTKMKHTVKINIKQ